MQLIGSISYVYGCQWNTSYFVTWSNNIKILMFSLKYLNTSKSLGTCERILNVYTHIVKKIQYYLKEVTKIGLVVCHKRF